MPKYCFTQETSLSDFLPSSLQTSKKQDQQYLFLGAFSAEQCTHAHITVMLPSIVTMWHSYDELWILTDFYRFSVCSINVQIQFLLLRRDDLTHSIPLCMLKRHSRHRLRLVSDIHLATEHTSACDLRWRDYLSSHTHRRPLSPGHTMCIHFFQINWKRLFSSQKLRFIVILRARGALSNLLVPLVGQRLHLDSAM